MMGLFRPTVKVRPPAITPFEFPSVEDRATIVGMTGSGKTQFGAYLLSEAPFHEQPYVIIDFKREKLFRATDRIVRIDYNEIPKVPGLYRLDAHPHEQDKIEKWLWAVWKKENIGLLFDEGYLIDKYSHALRSLLVTGRSKHIPVYILSQRPVDLPMWAFSEANYLSVFDLNWKKDREKVKEYLPEDLPFPVDESLSKYSSRWYDGHRQKAFLLQPAPGAPQIIERIDSRLRPKVRVIK
jgi:hypothetical protein